MSTFENSGRSLTSSTRETTLHKQIRDTRRYGQLISDFLQLPYVMAVFYALLAITLIIRPQVWLLIMPVWFTVWFMSMGREKGLPFNLPFTAGVEDKNDPKPGRRGYQKARGMLYMGNDLETNEELYLNFDTVLRHFLIFGTTGAGKTETILSILSNFLAVGSGLIVNDAKATPNLSWQVYTMARFFGRDDDFLVTNYLTGNSSEKPDPAARLTNDMAPFAMGSAQSAAQLVIQLMPEDKGGSNKVFSEAAVALVNAVMPALCELRDKGLLVIDPRTIRTYMEYANCCQLMSHPLVSLDARRAITAFIRSRSGYNVKKPFDKQPEEVGKQFGFAQAYFIRALSTLSDVYGNIYMTGAGEIDYQDVILNDRILTTLLPSMEKSSEEMGNLSKLVLSGMKNAMAIGLGYEIEGYREEVLESLATANNRPFALFNDEYAFMAVQGFAISAAQARGLNICCGFGGQDYAGFKNADANEAEQIVANTRFKYIMAQEDAGATLELIKNLAGEMYVTMSSGHEVLDDSMGRDYVDTLKTNVQKVQRLDVRDLRSLEQGEGFGFYKDTIVLMRNFWHGFTDQDGVKYFRVGKRIMPKFRPNRGTMAKVLDIKAELLRQETRVWLEHLEEDDINHDIVQSPKEWEPALEAINGDVATQQLTPAEQGLYFLGKMFESFDGDYENPAIDSDDDHDEDDSADSPPSILGSLSGNFGADVDSNDDALAQAIDEVNSFMESLNINENNPVSRSLKDFDDDELAATEGDLTEKAREADPSSFFTPLEELVLTQGVANIEMAGGASEDEAKQSGKAALSMVKAATDYPRDPKPMKSEADQDRLALIVKQFIKGGDSDD